MTTKAEKAEKTEAAREERAEEKKEQAREDRAESKRQATEATAKVEESKQTSNLNLAIEIRSLMSPFAHSPKEAEAMTKLNKLIENLK